MLVSTLLFILIGFVLIVLFSMIPVLWRIRTDYFAIGGRDKKFKGPLEPVKSGQAPTGRSG
jgi:hypothetical protein